MDGAIADYNRAIEIDPKNSYTYVNRGIAKKAKGHLDGAIADYNRAIEIDPRDIRAYSNRGNAKKAKGDLDGAIADCNRVIEINPKDFLSYCYRANAKQAKGDLNGAMADLNLAIKINSKFVAAYFGLASCEYLGSNMNGALSDFRHASDLSTQGVFQDYFQLYIWITRTRLGEGKAADKELAAHLEKVGNTTTNEWIRKVAGHLLGKVTEADLIAAAASPDARKKSGQICEAWYYIGMKKLFSGDKKTATEDFYKCLDTKRDEFTEFQFAEAELNALAKP